MRTALYARVSTSDKGQDPEMQLRELREYCQRRGFTIAGEYVDVGVSGSKDSRPELNRLMQDIRAGKIERVVCYKLDRLGRSLTHLALMLDEMSRLRVPLICSSQGIDTSDDNPAGRLQLGVLMAVAEFERGIIRERVAAGIAAAKARGVRLGRPATLRNRKAEVEKLRSAGLGIRAIAGRLRMAVSSVHSVLNH